MSPLCVLGQSNQLDVTFCIDNSISKQCLSHWQVETIAIACEIGPKKLNYKVHSGILGPFMII